MQRQSQKEMVEGVIRNGCKGITCRRTTAGIHTKDAGARRRKPGQWQNMRFFQRAMGGLVDEAAKKTFMESPEELKKKAKKHLERGSKAS